MSPLMALKAVNERGRLIGASHPLALLTDHEIDLVHELREAGLSLSQIAQRMECSKSCIAHVISGRRRGQTPVAWVQPGQPAPARPAPASAVRDDVGARLQAIIDAAAMR
ncbi:hypothetical protein CJ010_09690 [Azoarcus sp. DD4]|uniref:hypothetical protein n=1 Tax=Azoarcus sp. DD4 TaxID=2027405 RepID=UPI00112CC6CC|nr:hypothetical protein [Azoarcus sp. DD4]QDF96781.1 hypothetical protein CJ010_09690 [Azoarcus sp. DD4]